MRAKTTAFSKIVNESLFYWDTCNFLMRLPRATALENAVAYVRSTKYDVRFIDNVRVAQIFGSLTCAEIPLEPSS